MMMCTDAMPVMPKHFHCDASCPLRSSIDSCTGNEMLCSFTSDDLFVVHLAAHMACTSQGLLDTVCAH